ncbi:hypothetical protein pb186bvf_014863 [Paramecium bursaria]
MVHQLENKILNLTNTNNILPDFDLFIPLFFDKLRAILVENHQRILLDRCIAPSTAINLMNYKQLMTNSIYRSDQLLMSLKHLYDFSLKDDLIIYNDANQCLQQHPNDTVLLNSTFCYGLFGTSQENLKMIKLAKLLSNTYLLLDMDNLYYASVTPEEFFSYWPGLYFTNSFIPQQRPWYIQHFHSNNTNLIKYSKPYISYDHVVLVAKTIDLQKDAVGAVDTNLNSFSFIQSLNETLQVIDDQGLLYYTPQYTLGYVELLYFQNTSITGFTNNDLIQIQKWISNQSYKNSCQVQIKGSICLQNQQNQDFNFFYQQIRNPNQTLLVRLESYTFSEIIDDLFKIFDEYSQSVISSLIVSFLAALIFCCFILSATMHVLQKPIDRLLICTQMFVNNQQIQELLKISIILCQKYKSDTIKNLQEGFMRIMSLQQNNMQSHSEKQRIEQLQYPFIETYLKLPHSNSVKCVLLSPSIKCATIPNEK